MITAASTGSALGPWVAPPCFPRWQPISPYRLEPSLVSADLGHVAASELIEQKPADGSAPLAAQTRKAPVRPGTPAAVAEQV